MNYLCVCNHKYSCLKSITIYIQLMILTINLLLIILIRIQLKDITLMILQKKKGVTLLMKFVLLSEKNPELSRSIVFTEKEVNTQTEAGYTALILASKINNAENTVKLLLDHKADVNMRLLGGWTALMMASRYTHTNSTVKLLLAHRANATVHCASYWTPLMLAVYSNPKSVELLLENKSDVNKQNESGHTAIIIANDVPTVELLFRYGADVNMKSDRNLFVIEIQIRNDDICKLLIEFGAMFDKTNKNNMKLAVMKNDMFEEKLKDKQNRDNYHVYMTDVEKIVESLL